jgi:phosphatidylglycerophosphate synthase
LTLDELRGRSEVVAGPLAAAAERWGLTPNQLSAVSLAFAVLAAAFYYLSNSQSWLLYVAAFMVLLNALFDLTDGALARRTGKADPKGDFLDHVIDRYADMFILAGMVFAGYVPWPVGFLAAVGIMLTSYIGTQAQALQLGRYYGGIMGRADRLAAIIIATAANAIYPQPVAGLTLLGWLIVAIMLSSHITALQRFGHIWRRL